MKFNKPIAASLSLALSSSAVSAQRHGLRGVASSVLLEDSFSGSDSRDSNSQDGLRRDFETWGSADSSADSNSNSSDEPDYYYENLFVTNFYERKCESEGIKVHNCIEKNLANAKNDADIKKWAQSFEKAVDAAEHCVRKTNDDTITNFKCYSHAYKIANKYCSTIAFMEACSYDHKRVKPVMMFEDFVSSSSADGYGLGGYSFLKPKDTT